VEQDQTESVLREEMDAARQPIPAAEVVLRWAGTPLATREVAEVCQLTSHDAREQLGRVASERHLGFEGLWKLSPSAA